MNKIHMKAAIDRDTRKGKTRTLCGRFVDDNVHTADNPSGDTEVTCRHCLRILMEYHNEL